MIPGEAAPASEAAAAAAAPADVSRLACSSKEKSINFSLLALQNPRYTILFDVWDFVKLRN